METLIDTVRQLLQEDRARPFSVFSSVKEQRILNASIEKPLLVCVLAGVKKLGQDDEIVCPAGSFVFLPNIPQINMRNIPGQSYFAVLVEFELSDFDQFTHQRHHHHGSYVQGTMDVPLVTTLRQFMEWSSVAPAALWASRRRELLQLLYLSGHDDISRIAGMPGMAHQLHDIIRQDVAGQWSVARLAGKLAISESTLRRRLRAEGYGVKSIVHRTRLGHGLFMVQTTMEPIGRIAEACGYQSQSRFTDHFKRQFGITPSALRNTRMPG